MPEFDDLILVAWPAADDPVNEAGPAQAHLTLAYLGKLDDAGDDDVAKVTGEVRRVAAGHGPVTVPVMTRGPLGSADVLHLDAEQVQPVRDELLAQPVISAMADGQEYNDPWLPHLSLAYDDEQADEDDGIDRILFDAVGILGGDRVNEKIPLGTQESADMSEATVAPAMTDRIPDGTFVTWPYRGTHGGGYVRGVRKPGKTSADTEYKIEQVDDHVSSTGSKEPTYVYHYGRVLTKADPKKWKAAHEGGDASHDGATQSFATAETSEVPFHSVLLKEGVVTGDRRKFAAGSARWADLPIPLLYQEVSDDRHLGSTVVGRIDEIERDGDLIKVSGALVPAEKTSAVINLIAAGALRGVSVDVDDATFEFEGEGTAELGVIADGRIRAATIVAIPAFVEATIALGTWDDAAGDGSMDKPEPQDQAMVAAATVFAPSAGQIDEGSWSGDAGGYTPEQWYRATLIHLGDKNKKGDNKLPILTPSGKLSRAGVHAAASRLNQVQGASADQIAAAKASLRQAYRMLKEDPPDSLKAALDGIEAFGPTSNPTTHDGPGWFTHPVDTQRLANYWTKGEGAAKIGWGLKYDFYRCELLLAQYVKPEHLAGYCSNRHKDALGVWPGQEKLDVVDGVAAASINLVASSVATTAPPREWFEDPGFDRVTPLEVTEDGRVFGHIAAWDSCHLAEPEGPGICTTPPRGDGTYRYFRTGVVTTDDGDVTVGQLTVGTGHAGVYDSMAAATAHYDDTGTAVADVAAGDDAYGIWVAGYIRPGTDQDRVTQLRASAISGDWRAIGGSLELVAALAVNSPGFPIPRTETSARDGRQYALVASGVVLREQVAQRNDDQLERIITAALDARELRERRRKLAGLRGRHTATASAIMAAIKEKRNSDAL